MTKKKKITILVILIGLLTIASSVLASRASWPDTPAGHPFPDEGIPELIRYFYEWGISLGGLLVFVALLIAGFQYTASAGNPAMMKEAKDRINSAFFGLVLLLGSWLILNTINPQLTHFPELILDLSKIAETATSTFAERSAYPCEWGYVFGEKDYQGNGGYMKPDDIQDQKARGGAVKTFLFPNGVEFDAPMSVQVWRRINCYGCDNCNEEYNKEDELMLSINQAIAVCQNEKLAAMTPGEIAMGTKPACDESEIISLVEKDLEEKYTFARTTDPIKGDAGDCPAYNIKEENFNIDYSITIPKYFISDGNCTFQLHQRTWTGGCGDRISEIVGTYPSVQDYTDVNIECIKLVAVPSGKKK